MNRQLMALFVVAALMPWPLLITGDHWWAFIFATAAIVTVLRLLLGRQWRDPAGLEMSPVPFLLAIAAFALIAMGSKLFLQHVYAVAGLKTDAPAVKDKIGFLFQAFNEEIFYRALLVGLLIRWVPSATLISLGTAFVFAAAHFLMYRFTNPMHFTLSQRRSRLCSVLAWR